MLKIFISLRCMGVNYNEIVRRRDHITEDYIKQHRNHSHEIEIIDSLFSDYVPGESNPIEFLGRSIEKMKDADVVLIPIDYKKSKGCKIEKEVAQIYGLPINSYIYTDERCYFLNDFVDTYEVENIYVK